MLTRHDYLPYGEEIGTAYGNRSSIAGYTASRLDGPTQKFTGKERDGESGLDYFEARYYSGAQGRFTSADPLVVPRLQFEDENRFAALIDNPQNWNKYVYARNNPLRNIDPDGLQTRELNEEELRRIHEEARRSSPDSATALFAFFNNLGADVLARGEDVRNVLSESSDEIPEEAMTILEKATTVSKKGSSVTITSSKKIAIPLEKGLKAVVTEEVAFKTSSSSSITDIRGIPIKWKLLKVGRVGEMNVVSGKGSNILEVVPVSVGNIRLEKHIQRYPILKSRRD